MKQLLLALLAVCALTGTALAEPRVALVIGNSGYGAEIGALANPANDAKLMAQTLRGIGFTVIEVEDADQNAMKRAIAEFGGRLSDAGSEATGLFYYAGHGMQSGGENYLIPLGAKIERETDLDIEAVPANLVLKQMDFADSAVNIVILDACRNNPLARGFRSASRGLAETRVKPHGSFIAYSTAPDETAADGSGANSPYTTALAQSIVTPGLGIEEVFRDIRGKVLAATNNKQTPWDSSSLTAPFYFVPAAAAPTPVAAAAPASAIDPKTIELEFWAAIKDSKSADDYSAYLEKFPNGDFAPIARNRLKALTGATVAVAEPAAPAAPSQSADRAAFEQAFWDSVKDSDSPEDLEVYLAKYPNGTFAPDAKKRASDLRKAAALQQLAATVPPPPIKVAPEIATAGGELYAKDKARLRATPAADATVVARLDAGTRLAVTGRSNDGQWWRVSLADGRQGFVAASVVTDQAPPQPQPAPVAAAPVPSPAPAPAEPGPDPEIAAASKVPAGKEHDLCLKGANGPTDIRAVACRRLLAAGVPDVTDRYNAQLGLGDALFDLGKNDEALTAYRAAVEIDPEFFSAYDGVGAVMMSLGQYDEARAAFDKAVALNPDDPNTLYQRGAALSNVGAFKAARADLRKAIEKNAGDRTYYDQLGVVDLALGDPAAALADIEHAIAADPQYWGSAGMLIYHLNGRYDRSIAMAEAGRREQPLYPYFYIWMALSKQAAGDAPGAQATLAEAAKALGGNAWPMPVIDFVAGRSSEAALRDAAEAAPDLKTQIERQCEVEFYAGEVAYLAGDKATARAHFRASVATRVYQYLELAAAQARLAQLN